MKAVIITRQAQRTLRRIDGATRDRIVAKIEQYAADPASLANNVRALAGSDLLRLRVGDWRVIFTDEDDMIIVRIAPRGGAYD